MFLTAKSQYSIMSMVDLAYFNKNSDNPVTINSIAERQNIKKAFLEQIFIHLRRATLVKSKKGPGGGYVLNKKESEITLLAILEAVGESVEMTRCKKQKTSCVQHNINLQKCMIHDFLNDLGGCVKKYLQNTTIADICENLKAKHCLANV